MSLPLPFSWGCHFVPSLLRCPALSAHTHTHARTAGWLAGWLAALAGGLTRRLAQGTNLPAVGTHQALVLGPLLFNFGWVTTVPSWVNEKKPTVDVNRVLW